MIYRLLAVARRGRRNLIQGLGIGARDQCTEVTAVTGLFDAQFLEQGCRLRKWLGEANCRFPKLLD